MVDAAAHLQSLSRLAQTTAALVRDQRQKDIYAWVLRTFGADNATLHERALRLFEEVVELMQAEGLSAAELVPVIDHVYSKPMGKPAQEVGGIATTLLAYCQARGISADSAEAAEFARIMSTDPEVFRARHNVKAAAGIARKAPGEGGAPR